MFGPDRPQKHEILDNDGLPLPARSVAYDDAVAKYDRQMQAAFDAEAEHRDCCCDASEVNPFCKTHARLT